MKTCVVVDPGHGYHNQARHHFTRGKRDSGAIGFNKHEEHFVVLIGDKVCNLLRKWCIQAFSTRSSGSWGLRPHDYNLIWPGTRRDALHWRREEAKQIGATHFVSLHLNGFWLQSARGTETFVRPDASKESLALAKSIQGSLLSCLYYYDSKRNVPHWNVKDRGVKRARLGVLRLDIPCCLVEPEFITNLHVNKLLEDSGFVWTIAYGIASGIRKFINNEELQ